MVLRINSQENLNLNVKKNEAIREWQENTEERFCDLGLGLSFVKITQNLEISKKEVNWK